MSDDRAEALIEERRGYLVRGLRNRVAQIDAELARLGIAVTEEMPIETGDAAPVKKSRKA